MAQSHTNIQKYLNTYSSLLIMSLDRNIIKFKKSFWGNKPITTVFQGKVVHKVKSLGSKNARFLEKCTIQMHGIPIEFSEAKEMGNRGSPASVYLIMDGEKHYNGCYARCSPNSVLALDALYAAFNDSSFISKRF